jgi:hypothetical protein
VKREFRSTNTWKALTIFMPAKERSILSTLEMLARLNYSTMANTTFANTTMANTKITCTSVVGAEPGCGVGLFLRKEPFNATQVR